MNRTNKELLNLNENITSIIKDILKTELELFKEELISHMTELHSTNKRQDVKSYPADKLFKPAKAAKLLNISTKTLGRWRKKGEIPSILVNGTNQYRYTDIARIMNDQDKKQDPLNDDSEERPSYGRKGFLQTHLN